MATVTLRKPFTFLLAMTLTPIAFAQNRPPGIQIVNASATTQPVPTHLLYRHFLLWVRTRYDNDQAAGVTDPYHFAAPFAKAGLQNGDWDAILAEAQLLEADITQQDQKASAIIQAFRPQAKEKLNNGAPLPQAPNMLELQQERDTLIKSHISILHARLGAASSAKLDQCLSRAIAPHVSLKSIAAPKPNSPPGTLPAFK